MVPLGNAGLLVVSVSVPTPQPRADLFLGPGSDPRQGGPRLDDEPTTLTETLRYQRLTVQPKCDGLNAGQLARRGITGAAQSTDQGIGQGIYGRKEHPRPRR